MARKQVWMDESLFERVTTGSDLNKEQSLNNAVSVYMAAKEIVGKEYPSASDDAIEDNLRQFLSLKKRILSEVKGVFSRPELVGILDAFNGTMITGISISAKSLLTAQMEDAETYNSAGTWHGYDTTALLAKIESLSTAQAEIWLHEIIRFWSEGLELEGFLNTYRQA